MEDLCNSEGSSAGVILENKFRLVVEFPLGIEFSTTNNQTKYVSVIVGVNLTGGSGG